MDGETSVVKFGHHSGVYLEGLTKFWGFGGSSAPAYSPFCILKTHTFGPKPLANPTPSNFFSSTLNRMNKLLPGHRSHPDVNSGRQCSLGLATGTEIPTVIESQVPRVQVQYWISAHMAYHVPIPRYHGYDTGKLQQGGPNFYCSKTIFFPDTLLVFFSKFKVSRRDRTKYGCQAHVHLCFIPSSSHSHSHTASKAS